jgi:hypothetical protein
MRRGKKSIVEVDGIVDEEDYDQDSKPTKRVQTSLSITRPLKRRDHSERLLEMTKPKPN